MDNTPWSPKRILSALISRRSRKRRSRRRSGWRSTGASVAVAHVLSDVRKAMLDMPTDARWQLVAGDVDAFERSLRSKSDEKLDALDRTVPSARQRHSPHDAAGRAVGRAHSRSAEGKARSRDHRHQRARGDQARVRRQHGRKSRPQMPLRRFGSSRKPPSPARSSRRSISRPSPPRRLRWRVLLRNRLLRNSSSCMRSATRLPKSFRHSKRPSRTMPRQRCASN